MLQLLFPEFYEVIHTPVLFALVVCLVLWTTLLIIIPGREDISQVDKK